MRGPWALSPTHLDRANPAFLSQPKHGSAAADLDIVSMRADHEQAEWAVTGRGQALHRPIAARAIGPTALVDPGHRQAPSAARIPNPRLEPLC